MSILMVLHLSGGMNFPLEREGLLISGSPPTPPLFARSVLAERVEMAASATIYI